MTAHPAAYLRRSYVDPQSPGDISLEAQRAAVGRLAAADGHNGNVREYSDWGISADVAKAATRTAYSELLADMEAGRVSAVYAFDVDRLYRDPRDLIRLQDAAQRHRVRIVTTGGPLAIGDGDDPAAEAFAFIGSVFGRMELQKAKKRAMAAQDARRARGDRFGHPPYGSKHVKDETGRIVRVPDPSQPLDPILDAYREAGTILGTVKLLNARGIPSPKGKTWHTSALTRIIERSAPELLPRKGASGKRIRPTRNSSVLAQLVRCHCGATMTPNTVRRQLYCSRGVTLGRQKHGRYVATEAYLLPWIKEEAARLAPNIDLVRIAEQNAARRDALEAQRERLGWAVTDGLLTRDQARAKAEAIDEELATLADREEVIEVPQVDWTWPPAELNAVLRSLFAYIELDRSMRPIRAEWRIPEWRRP